MPPTSVSEDFTAQGDDKVFSSISYTFGANVEDLALLDSGGAINGTGNGLANDIYGNDSDNTLDGGAGDDRMVGNGGNDTYIVGSTSTRGSNPPTRASTWSE